MQRRTFLAASAALAASSGLPMTAIAAETTPLTKPWTGPYGGVPAFDQVKVSDFVPALTEAMAAERAEVDAIVANKAAPTFDNTILALERAGMANNRVQTVTDIWSGTLSTPAVRAVDTEMAPKLAAHGDAILQNHPLFLRIEAVYNARASLTPEQQRLTWVYWNRFVRSGAKLTPAAKTRIAAINQELAGYFDKFSQNLLADETDYVLYLSNEC